MVAWVGPARRRLAGLCEAPPNASITSNCAHIGGVCRPISQACNVRLLNRGICWAAIACEYPSRRRTAFNCWAKSDCRLDMPGIMRDSRTAINPETLLIPDRAAPRVGRVCPSQASLPNHLLRFAAGMFFGVVVCFQGVLRSVRHAFCAPTPPLFIVCRLPTVRPPGITASNNLTSSRRSWRAIEIMPVEPLNRSAITRSEQAQNQVVNHNSNRGGTGNCEYTLRRPARDRPDQPTSTPPPAPSG